jgi:hypothetical protein
MAILLPGTLEHFHNDPLQKEKDDHQAGLTQTGNGLAKGYTSPVTHRVNAPPRRNKRLPAA